MKRLGVLLLLSSTLLLGCSSVAVEKHKPEPQPTSQEAQREKPTSDVNKPFEIGHWQITLKPREVDLKSPEFDNYSLDCIYLGNSKVTHAKISFGNGNAETHEISHGEGMVISSTFPKNTKQMNFSITTTEAGGETVTQSLILNTGE